MLKLCCSVVTIFTLLTGPAALDRTTLAAAEISDSVVRIHSSRQSPDFLRPWTKGTARQSTGSGVIIGENRILTNAHVVQYASRLLVQAEQSTKRVPAKVVAFAPGIDLALLELQDESFFAGRPALPLADGIPSLKDTVNTYGFPIGGDQLSITEGIISRIDFSQYFDLTTGLRIQIDAALNPGNSGGPAIADDKIVGLVFSGIPSAENIGYLIPAEEIRLFLDDVKDGAYDGKYKIFEALQSVRNAALRERLKMPEQMGGVLVREPLRNDDNYPLKQWDVITHIGDVALDRQGNVSVNDALRLSFRYMIPRLQKNGSVPLTIFRDASALTIDFPLSVDPHWLIPPLNGQYPRHFIVGPMVFSAATQDLIRALGPRGQSMLAGRRNPLISRRFDIAAFDDEELVVMGARMFPHPIHEGYDQQTFGVVSHINDDEVRNLAHLVKLIRDAEGDFITIKVAGKYESMVYPREELLEITEEILENEGIRYQYSKDLEAIWTGADAETTEVDAP